MESDITVRKTYTEKEACERTGMSIHALRRAVRKGGIAAIKPGGKWLILREPLDRMLRGETPTA